MTSCYLIPHHHTEHSPLAPRCPWDGDHSLHGPVPPGRSPLQPCITHSPSSLPLLALSLHGTSGLLHRLFPYLVWLMPTQPLLPPCSSYPEAHYFLSSPVSTTRLSGPGPGPHSAAQA